MADREFLLKVIGDVSGAQKSLGNLEKDVGGFKSTMKGAAIAIGGFFAVSEAVDFGKAMVGAASDQEQAFGAVNSVFGEYADTIHASAEQAAGDVGLATSQYEQLATLTGALLKNAGVPLDEVAESAKNLTQVGADLSAMYGGTAADAMGAINSALKGEMDPLEAFGVSLKASAIEAKAVSMGLVDAAGKATDYGKKMATVALIQEQAADSAGTFAKESGSVAGQSQILGAQFKNLQAELGAKLLPMVVKFSGVLIDLVGFVQRNQGWLIPTVAAIGGIVLAIKAWQLASAAWIVIQEAATAVQLAFNVAMSMNPIGLIVIAIAALVAGLILAYQKVGWFREAVDATAKAAVEAFDAIVDAVKWVIDFIKDHWELLFVILTGPFGLAVLAIIEYWDEILRGLQWLIDRIRQAVTVVFDILTYPYRRAWDEIKRLFDLISPYIATIVGAIRDALSDVWRTVSAPFERGINVAMGWIDSLLNKVWGIAGNVYNFMVNVADTLYQPFKAAFDAIRGAWNNTVGGFGFTVPSFVPEIGGKSFKIPKMAAGGIVSRPTIAMIGEAGPEAVVPLRGGFGNTIINVYALTANAEVGRKVYEALREYERSSGQTFTGQSTGLTIFAA